MFLNHLTKLRHLLGILNFQIDCKQITKNWSLQFFKLRFKIKSKWCFEILCIWYILAKVTTCKALFLQIYKYDNNNIFHMYVLSLILHFQKITLIPTVKITRWNFHCLISSVLLCTGIISLHQQPISGKLNSSIRKIVFKERVPRQSHSLN